MQLFKESRKEPDDSFIRPGYGVLRSKSCKLWTVVGSSVALTIYDRGKSIGGMTHYTRPFRDNPKISTPFYAAPAIVWLVRQFEAIGCERRNLEAQVVGGAFSQDHPDFMPHIHDQNVAVGLEILAKQQIWVSTMDVGGIRGRKIVFNPKSGESAIARVDNIRSIDWYPPPES